MNDPYRVLGLTPGANEEDIKKAYRTLVKQYHPDLHPGDEAAARKMSEINEAYEAIRSGNVPQQRQPGSYGNMQGRQGSFDREGETFFYSYMDPDDILEAIFGALGSFSAAGAYRRFGIDPEEYDLYALFEKYLDRGSLYQAAAVLNAVPKKDGRWHYCAARLNLENGDLAQAQHHAEWAVSLEPGESRYKELYDRIEELWEESARRVRRSHIIVSAVGIIFALVFLVNIIYPLIPPEAFG